MAFPYLRHLMDTYFNQDFDLYGDSDAAILRQYVAETLPAQVAATRAELERFLELPLDGLKDRYREETGRDNVSIGESDTQARDWLLLAARILGGLPE